MSYSFFELSDEQKSVLDAMLEAEARGKITYRTWEEVRAFLQARLVSSIEDKKSENAGKTPFDIHDKLNAIKHKEV